MQNGARALRVALGLRSANVVAVCRNDNAVCMASAVIIGAKAATGVSAFGETTGDSADQQSRNEKPNTVETHHFGALQRELLEIPRATALDLEFVDLLCAQRND